MSEIPWFKVDDRFPRHRKARAVRRSHADKGRDVAPFGLWVLAGAESDDGFIAAEVLEDWDDDADELASRLVAAGLWRPAVRDGEPGFEFHDWTEHNPADASESGSFGNHVRWHRKRGKVDAECPHCEVDEERKSSGRIAPDIAPDSGRISPPNRYPSRPDPTRPDLDKPCASADAEREFETWWAAYPRKRGKGQAARAYRTARKKATAEALLDAIRQQAPTLTARGAEYVPYPATWLNGERWTDQPDATLPVAIPRQTSRQQADAEMFARQMARAEAREAAARGEIA